MTQSAIFGGGCFWCTEAIFLSLKGVISALPGYIGGQVINPTHEQVCTGTTGHAEAVKIEFDPSLITFEDLLTVFFATHDPTTLNRQGHDIGTQYRSAVFYTTPEQKQIAENFIADLDSSSNAGAKIVTEVTPAGEFYPAEDYHKNYFARNQGSAYCQAVINPKLTKVKERFSNLLRANTEGT